MLLGVHISGVIRISDVPVKAHELGTNTCQFFSRSPQRWRSASIDEDEIALFRKNRDKFKISPVFIHIPYLINLASPNPRLYKGSIEAYIEDIREAEKLGADYIVTHMGSHKNTLEIAGLARLAKALNKIETNTKGSSVGILLENTAGSGSWLGYKFSHHRRVLAKLKDRERFGVCLDTAHAYLAGYDIATHEGLESMLDDIQRNVGLDSVKLIHLNDAKDKLGSHHDRHEHIGKGNIGIEGMKRIINHPALKNKPFVLETPKDSEDANLIDLGTVRKLRGLKHAL